MLRFFSSIRKTLINEGKTSRYVRYAVGEFMLIVLGILVALQIQNWNEGRKQGQQRLELIENLKQDFKSNLTRFNESLALYDATNEGLQNFLRAAVGDNDDLTVEEIKTLAENAFVSIPTTPVFSAYETAVSTGFIKLIADPSLTELFIRLGTSKLAYGALRDMNREDVLIGASAELRKKLGSVTQLLPAEWGRVNQSPLFEPEAFQLSDQEFREFIAQKEVYSIFESRLLIRSRTRNQVSSLKRTTEQILTALEALE